MNRITPTCPPASRSRQRGVSLVEIMVSLFLGLVLVGAATSIYLANRQTFRQIENVARLQENARTTFELLARDVREAGGIACGSNLPTANVVQGGAWWTQFGTGIRGYGATEVLPARAFGTNAGDRISGTEAIVVWSGTAESNVRIVSHNPTSAQFQVSTNNHGFVDGDVVVACDYQQAAITQVSNANASNTTIVHNTGSPIAPGNCRKELGLSNAPPHNCTTAGSDYTFAGGGFISKLQAVTWYVGNNGRGGSSLYRINLQGQPQEVIENVTDLEIFFLTRDASGAVSNSYAALQASAQTIDWARVIAVRMAPVYRTAEAVGTNGAAISHTLPFVVSLRNRLE